MTEDYRPRLTVDLGALRRNCQALRARHPEAEVAPVVKANAYGLGAEPVVKTLAAEGCTTFFVAYPDQAQALLPWMEGVVYCYNAGRNSGPYTNRIRPVLHDSTQIQNWQGGPCAIQVELGINRMGLREEELDSIPTDLDVQIILGHLSDAGQPSSACNAAQQQRFADLCDKLRTRFPKTSFSLSATGGAMLPDGVAEDLIRPGIGLFGGSPGEQGPLETVAMLEARVLTVRSVTAGERVGYNGLWTAERASRIATLAIGYADGVPRALAGNGHASFRGKTFPMVGAISMDLITVDVTDGDGPSVGDWVEVFGTKILLDDVADQAGTIGYELLTSLSHRVRRVYAD